MCSTSQLAVPTQSAFIILYAASWHWLLPVKVGLQFGNPGTLEILLVSLSWQKQSHPNLVQGDQMLQPYLVLGQNFAARFGPTLQYLVLLLGTKSGSESLS